MAYNNQTIPAASFYQKRNNLRGGNSASLNTLNNLTGLNRDEKRLSFSTPARKKNLSAYYHNDRRSSPNSRRPCNRSPNKRNDDDYPRQYSSTFKKRKLFSEVKYFKDDKPMKKSRSNSEEDFRKIHNSPNDDSYSYKSEQSSSNQSGSSIRNPFSINDSKDQINLLFRDDKVLYRNNPPIIPVTIEEVRKGEDKENAINKIDSVNHSYSSSEFRPLNYNLDTVNRQLDSSQLKNKNYSDYNQNKIMATDEDKQNNYSQQQYSSSSNLNKMDTLYPVALRNLGNTCYMNSIVQPLFNLPFLMCELRDSMERASLINSQLNFSMTKSLVELFEEYKRMRKTQSTNDEELERRLCAFKYNVGQHSAEFKSSGQHDAVEFLDSVINSIDEEFDKVKKTIPNCNNPVNKVFKIELGEASHCETCNLKSNIVKNKSHCLILSLPEENTDCNLQQILKNYFKPEKRESKCEKCGNKERNRYLTVLKSPRVLILQLGRYSATGEKRHEPIRVPFEISLPKVLKKERSNEGVSQNQQTLDNIFELSGVICHHGSCLAGGHYICYIHDRLNSEWYHCDDENIVQTTFERVQEGSKSSGYCFFYLNKKYI